MKNLSTFLLFLSFFMIAGFLVFKIYRYFNEKIMGAKSMLTLILLALTMILLLCILTSLALYALIASVNYMGAA